MRTTQRQTGSDAKSTPFDLARSAARLCATYRGEPTDRVPMMTPIRWSPHQDIDSQHFDDWRDEEGFRKIARLVQEHCDVKPTFNAVAYPGVFAPISYQRFLEAPAEYVEKLPPEKVSDKRTRHTTLLHTPKGDLEWAYEEDEGIFTNWDMRKPVQNPEDVEKMLSVPYKFEPPDSAEYEGFREHRASMGRDAIGGAGVNSMVAMLCGMMQYELLLEWTIAEPGLIKLLADAWLARTGEKVDFLLSQGVGPFWHFNGVERAVPPMMGPKQWEELVVAYDGEIMRRIKQADPDARIHVHCHGKVGTLLDSFVEMDVDSTDPTEPPPQGDVDLAEAKRKYEGRLTFFGNIEFLAMETKGPDEIEELVRRAIEDGGKQHTVLYPSAGPHERLTDRFTENAVRYIEAGLKYGQL